MMNLYKQTAFQERPCIKYMVKLVFNTQLLSFFLLQAWCTISIKVTMERTTKPIQTCSNNKMFVTVWNILTKNQQIFYVEKPSGLADFPS